MQASSGQLLEAPRVQWYYGEQQKLGLSSRAAPPGNDDPPSPGAPGRGRSQIPRVRRARRGSSHEAWPRSVQPEYLREGIQPAAGSHVTGAQTICRGSCSGTPLLFPARQNGTTGQRYRPTAGDFAVSLFQLFGRSEETRIVVTNAKVH